MHLLWSVTHRRRLQIKLISAVKLGRPAPGVLHDEVSFGVSPDQDTRAARRRQKGWLAEDASHKLLAVEKQ